MTGWPLQVRGPFAPSVRRDLAEHRRLGRKDAADFGHRFVVIHVVIQAT
jgi:hypothetical protein